MLDHKLRARAVVVMSPDPHIAAQTLEMAREVQRLPLRPSQIETAERKENAGVSQWRGWFRVQERIPIS